MRCFGLSVSNLLLLYPVLLKRIKFYVCENLNLIAIHKHRQVICSSTQKKVATGFGPNSRSPFLIFLLEQTQGTLSDSATLNLLPE